MVSKQVKYWQHWREAVLLVLVMHRVAKAYLAVSPFSLQAVVSRDAAGTSNLLLLSERSLSSYQSSAMCSSRSPASPDPSLSSSAR